LAKIPEQKNVNERQYIELKGSWW